MSNRAIQKCSRSQLFLKIVVLKNFAIFTENHLRWSLSLFKKATGMKACNFIINRLQRRCFPVNIAKYFRTTFLKNLELLRWLLLDIMPWKFEWLSRVIFYKFSEWLLLKIPCKEKHVQSQRLEKTLELLKLMLFECLWISLKIIFEVCDGDCF